MVKFSSNLLFFIGAFDAILIGLVLATGGGLELGLASSGEILSSTPANEKLKVLLLQYVTNTRPLALPVDLLS